MVSTAATAALLLVVVVVVVLFVPVLVLLSFEAPPLLGVLDSPELAWLALREGCGGGLSESKSSL